MNGGENNEGMKGKEMVGKTVMEVSGKDKRWKEHGGGDGNVDGSREKRE